MAQDASTGSIRLSLISCGEELLPEDVDFAAACHQPIEAGSPAYAIAGFGDDALQAVSIPDAPRDGDAYLLEDLPTGVVSLIGLSPKQHDSLTTIPAQSPATGDGILVGLGAGENVDFTVYYYNSGRPTPPGDPPEPNFFLSVRACPDGVEPLTDADKANCTLEADISPVAYIAAPPDMIDFVADSERDENGTYAIVAFTDGSGITNLEHPDYGAFVIDDGGTGGLAEDEWGGFSITIPPSGRLDATIYYYNPASADTPEPATPDTARITVHLVGCPSGIDPRNVDPAVACTEAVSASDAVMHSATTGTSYDLAELEVSPGVYVADVATSDAGNRVTFTGLEASSFDDNLIINATARISHGEFHVDVMPGDDVTVTVYYYHYD